MLLAWRSMSLLDEVDKVSDISQRLFDGQVSQVFSGQVAVY